MLDIILFGIIAGVMAWWLVTLADKRGWLTTLQSNAPNDWVWQLFSCHYCMSWWISLIICIIAVIFTGQWELMLSAFIGTLVGVKL